MPLFLRPLSRMCLSWKQFCLALGFLWGSVPGWTQELGFPPMASFPPSAYGGHSQVFQTAQDSRGIVYVTNFSAVLTYDGERWGRIPVPDTTFLYGLAVLPDDRLAVSGVGQIGLIEPDGRGGHAFRSLVPEVPETYRDEVGECWDLYATDEGVFFFSRRLMMRWHEGTMRVWRFETEKMIYGFWSGSAIYIQNLDHGLFRLAGDALLPVSEEPLFIAPGPRMLVDWDDGTQLVATMKECLWLLREGRLEPFPTEADAMLREGVFNRGVVLADGRLALGTFQNGVAIVDRDGGFDQHLHEGTGLPNNSITHLSLDREDGLWCSLAAGLVRVDLTGALSYYDRRNGLPSLAITEILRFRDTVYLASGVGLFRLRPVAPPAVPQWERVPGVAGEMYDLLVHDDALFAAVQGRVMRVTDEGAEMVWDDSGLVRVLEASKVDPTRLYVGGRNGLGTIVKEAGTWRSGGFVSGAEAYVQSVVEFPDGTVWAGTQRSGIWRLQSEAQGRAWGQEAVVEVLFEEAGLPPGVPLNVAEENGILRVNSFMGSFERKAATGTFAAVEPNNRPPLVEGWYWDVWSRDSAGQAWGSVYPAEGGDSDFNLYYGREAYDTEGERRWEWIPAGLFEPIGGVLHQKLEEVDGEDPILWVGGWTGLLRWNLARAPRGVPPVPLVPLVRRIFTEGGEALHAGAGDPPSLEIGYSAKALHFEFAAPVMGAGLRPEYRTRLSGFEDVWTPWSDATDRAFTNLREGTYRFAVEARTALGASARAAVVDFRIHPPWYRSVGAYLAYLLLGALAVWMLVRWRLAVVRRENEQLERTVASRTADLAASEASLRLARDEADRANQAKSQFLANMSHELRTPLNGILGYAQVLERARDLTPRNRERVSILRGSADHLLKLINEVLDLSKIEAQRMEIKPRAVELAVMLRTLAAMFQPRVDEKPGLSFTWGLAGGVPARVVLDEQKVGQVLFNLLGNAIKFTDTGEVSLRVEATPMRQLRFVVADTGTGIAPEAQWRIFEPFHQVEAENAPPGTGLGLAISSKLVEAMDGTIGVESAPGMGSRFWFELPLEAVVAGAAQSVAPAEVSGYAGARRTVLVVDDVAVNRGVVVELLEPLGFTVREAGGGEAALAAIAEARPDLVLLDMRMAPIDGPETIRRLRALPAGQDLPVVAYSASAIDFHREDALAIGCDELVAKPFRLEELIDKIGALLGLAWIREPGPVATPGDRANGLRAEVLERLRHLARRGEPAGLQRELARLGETGEAPEALLAELQSLVARFRMTALSEFLDTLSPIDE